LSCSASCRRIGIGLCASTCSYIRAPSPHPVILRVTLQ
jgi:hypothetical protein